MSGWRPIETAPVDQPVLVATVQGCCTATRYTGQNHSGQTVSFWWLVDDEGHAPWCYQDSQQIEIEPTHWMPLPDPPTNDKKPIDLVFWVSALKTRLAQAAEQESPQGFFSERGDGRVRIELEYLDLEDLVRGVLSDKAKGAGNAENNP